MIPKCEAFHTGLIIPHYDAAPAYNTVMETGMVFTIEPMLNQGGHAVQTGKDGWTVRTCDGLLSAQFEHTVAVTESGVRVLTLRPDETIPH